MSPPESRRLPLFAALQAAAGRTGFHMPGHAGGRAFEAWFREPLIRFDNTEIAVLDDLNRPSGPVLAAETIAAEVFGAARTHFITSGSTTSLFAALAAAVPAGGTVLLGRSVHKSVAHAMAMLDLQPVFLPAEPGLDHPLPVPAIPAGDPGPFSALVLTAPDYYGHLPDIAAFAAFAHRSGACLIVDAAHGAHLLVDPDLQGQRALAAGADLVVESAHKTLAALTPGSFLHLSHAAVQSGRIDPARTADMLRIFQTSSPSFPLAASLEYAVHKLAEEGSRRWRERRADIARCTEALPPPFRPVRTPPADALRLVLDMPGLSTAYVEAALLERGIDIELRDFRRLVLIVSLWQEPADFDTLLQALTEIAAAPQAAAETDLRLESRLDALLRTTPEFCTTPRQALFGTGTRLRVPIAAAVGLVAGETVTPTPPCVPLIWPGERISREQAEVTSAVLPAGAAVTVLADADVTKPMRHSC